MSDPTKAADLTPIETDEAAADAIEAIGKLDRDLARIEATKSQAVATAARNAEDRATPLLDQRRALADKVEAYCNANRERLTNGHRSKTAEFTTGSCAWRKGRGRVVVEPTLQEKILDRLKQLSGFVRVKEEIDVAAVGKSLAEDKQSPLKRIKGLRYEEGRETFTVKPTAAELVERTAA